MWTHDHKVTASAPILFEGTEGRATIGQWAQAGAL
jgi:hypothetical protein